MMREIRWKTEQYLLDELKTYEEVKLQIYKNSVEPQIMNQISPRIFSIGHKTGLVLFEGRYSDVISPNIHFILKGFFKYRRGY